MKDTKHLAIKLSDKQLQLLRAIVEVHKQTGTVAASHEYGPNGAGIIIEDETGAVRKQVIGAGYGDITSLEITGYIRANPEDLIKVSIVPLQSAYERTRYEKGNRIIKFLFISWRQIRNFVLTMPGKLVAVVAFLASLFTIIDILAPGILTSIWRALTQ